MINDPVHDDYKLLTDPELAKLRMDSLEQRVASLECQVSALSRQATVLLDKPHPEPVVLIPSAPKTTAG